jgi:beta-lactam-binding protein with PASTA domain
MRNLFRAFSAVLILLAIALVSALITMRLAIHGAEVRVPALIGLPLPEAAAHLHSLDLETGIDGRFYSTTQPAGHVLTQTPAPGIRVRKSWRVRVTVSLGPQKVAIPAVTGMDESIATITIHRTGLQLGNVVPLPYAYAPEGTIIAQTPLARAMDVEGPRIALLAAQPAPAQTEASIMPDLTGETFTAAAWSIIHSGFKLAPLQTPPAMTASVDLPATAAPAVAAPSISSAAHGTVIAQNPAAGSRIVAGAMIQLTVQP